MAQANDYLSALNVNHPDVNLMTDPTLTGLANTAASQGQSVSDFVNQQNNNPAIFNAYTQKYQTLAAPQISQTNQEYQNNAFGITANQASQDQQLQNSVQGLGPAFQGGTQAGEAGIGKVTQQALSYNDAQQANAIAQLALTSATNAQQDYNQDTANAYTRMQNEFTDSQSLPVGRSVNLGPGMDIQGSQYDPTSLLTTLASVAPQLSALGASGQKLLNDIAPDLATQLGIPLSDVQNAFSATPAANTPAAKPPTSNGGGTPPPATPKSSTVSVGSFGSIPSTTYSNVVNNLQTIFSQGNWAGQDTAANFQKLASTNGLTVPQAQYLYYQVRDGQIGGTNYQTK